MAELSERTVGAERTAVTVVGFLAWEWYAEHKADPIVKRKLLGIFIVTVTVEDLRPLFVRLFGQPQEGI